MAKREELIVGLDIGTTKIAAVVGELTDEGIDVIGVGSHPSTGLKKGVVVNIDSTVASIRHAIEEAEHMAGKIERTGDQDTRRHVVGEARQALQRGFNAGRDIDALGPSDSSDSGSDMQGIAGREGSDTDAAGWEHELGVSGRLDGLDAEKLLAAVDIGREDDDPALPSLVGDGARAVVTSGLRTKE